jgi:CRISPR-associated endonuclease/helicase Cas3
VTATRSTLAAGWRDPLDPRTFAKYFPLFQSEFPTADRHGIVDLLSSDKATFAFAFRTAADRFRLVDDADQATVVVPYRQVDHDSNAIDTAIEVLRKGMADRWVLRRLQRYTVQVRRRMLDAWQRQHDVDEVMPGMFVLNTRGLYDDRLGLLPEGLALDAASLVA